MTKENNNTHFEDFSGIIDIHDLFNALLNGKWVIISITSFIILLGFFYSISKPDIYESKAILISSSASSISGDSRNYAGLAGLAGISLSSTGGEGHSTKALKKIESLSFFKNNILPNINLPDLIAIKSWDHINNTITYDESIYDKKTKTWTKSDPKASIKIPTAQETYRVFKSKHLNLIKDNKTGFITISIKHQSPFIAKEWAELVVEEINNFYREKDKLEAQKAIDYLNKQISKTNLSQIKLVIAELIQDETQKLTLIEANQNYVFEYIDPPATMEQKLEPNRLFIVIFSAILGVITSMLIALAVYYIPKKN